MESRFSPASISPATALLAEVIILSEGRPARPSSFGKPPQIRSIDAADPVTV